MANHNDSMRNNNNLGMFLTCMLLVAFFCFNLMVCSTALQPKKADGDRHLYRRRYDEENNQDIQQKVALLDVMFTNGKKRICSGAIIHSYVVITAGHCFFGSKSIPQEFAEPELTSSFVVIGSKKKFDSGYENYLPIERILTHPDIKPWSCDLALVHTFASMTADKIGSVMPLAHERAYSSVDPNVTILSWGQVLPPDEVSLEDNLEIDKIPQESLILNPPQIEKEQDDQTQGTYNDPVTSGYDINIEDATNLIVIRGQVTKYVRESKPIGRTGEYNEQTTKISSRYLMSNDTKNEHTVIENEQPEDEPVKNKTKTIKRDSISVKRIKKTLKSGFWRRRMRYKEGHTLTVETFELINSLACKKMVEKFMSRYDLTININEIVCYDSDKQYVTDEDTGAPVIRHGLLIATTVGGIDIDGEHVAIGMKISHFCPWIAKNLPYGVTNFRCGEAHTGKNEHGSLDNIPDDDIVE